MSTIKITDLPVATTPLTNSEVIPLVQGNVTKQTPISSIGASMTYKRTGDANTVTRTVQSKLSDIISVWDFIPEGTDTNTVDCTNYIQNALNYAFNIGGGEVYLPAGVYRTTAPMIVRSNVHFRGDGAGSVIRRTGQGGSPFGNAIHIGYGYEYSYDRQYFSPAFNNDANLAQLLANNLTKLTTVNAKVSNIYVKDQTNGKGLGVWVQNALDCVIDSMWFENTKTPINIANDFSGWEAACYNITVNNIFQVSVDNGTDSWYDLVYCGDAVNVTISNCFNNPNTPSYLDGMMAVSLVNNLIVDSCALAGNNAAGKTGILYSGADVNTNYNVVISNNIVKNIARGINVFSASAVSVVGNMIYDCDEGLQLLGKRCLVDGNFFRNNTADLVGNGDATFNNITNNKGLSVLVNPNITWEFYNKFAGNTDISGNPIVASNGNTYGALMARSLAYHPVEAFFTSTDRAKAGFSQGANIKVDAGQTVTAYYKLETFVKKLRSAVVYAYADGAGDVITIKLVGNQSAPNGNGFDTDVTLATGTSAGAGDWSVGSSALNQTLYNNGGYYIAVVYAPADSDSQLRPVQLTVLTDA